MIMMVVRSHLMLRAKYKPSISIYVECIQFSIFGIICVLPTLQQTSFDDTSKSIISKTFSLWPLRKGRESKSFQFGNMFSLKDNFLIDPPN